MKNDRPKENEKGKYKDSLNFPLEIIVGGKDVRLARRGRCAGLEGCSDGAEWTYIFNGGDFWEME